MEDKTIELFIGDEKELYEPFDRPGASLSRDVVDYITDRIEEGSVFDLDALRIVSQSPVDRQRVENAFRRYADKKLRQLNHEKRLNRLRQLRLLAIGVVFVALAILLHERIHPIFVELISIIGSFSVWEAANIWIVGNPHLKVQRTLLKHLSGLKLTIDAPEENA